MRHEANPIASARCSMTLRPLRSSCSAAVRSIVMTAHAPQPRDSSRFRKWRKERIIAVRRRLSIPEFRLHVVKHRASLRCHRCRAARAISELWPSKSERHDVKPMDSC